MGNIKNFNFNKLDLKISNSDYWDFFLATDEGTAQPCNGLTSGDCFVVWYDFNNPSIYSGTAIYSLVSWTGATNSGYTMSTIGLTGIDNGLITFDVVSGDTTNQALLTAMTGSTLVIPSGDTRLILNRVTGTTGNFIYPIDYIIDPTFTTGDYVNLCGGFYQGYYKLDGNSYEVLPVRVPNAWAAEFWINPQDMCSGYTGTTLNDVYPENKGFFFYMGTRAENKYWNVFDGVDSGCTSGCTTGGTGCTDTLSPWCTTIKETDVVLIGDLGVGIPLSPPQVEIDIITNGFLIYGRAYDDSFRGLTGATDSFMFSGLTPTNDKNCGGCTGPKDGLGNQLAGTYDGEGLVVVKTASIVTNKTNPFLVYGRGTLSGTTSGTTGSTCGGCLGPNDGLGNETVGTFSGFTSPVEVNYNLDIIDSALGFRIKDDGSLGYRLLTMTGQCKSDRSYISGVTVEEAYSVSGMVPSNSWSYIAIRFVTEYQDECQLKTSHPRVGKLMFYVNGRLKFIVNEFSEIIAKRLHEYKSKQVGVPFNFSLGGGSQGLLESQTFDGLDQADRGLPIEKNFAGTFIGGISQFKFNICDLSFCDIQYNYMLNAKRYGIKDSDLLITEDGYIILQENGYGIQW
jgi:hypothetical protein